MWCGNWDCGRAVPFLGIFVSNFRYWFFAVYTTSTTDQQSGVDREREGIPLQTGDQKWFKLVCKHKIIKEKNGKCAAAHWFDPNIK